MKEKDICIIVKWIDGFEKLQDICNLQPENYSNNIRQPSSSSIRKFKINEEIGEDNKDKERWDKIEGTIKDNRKDRTEERIEDKIEENIEEKIVEMTEDNRRDKTKENRRGKKQLNTL